MASPFSKAVLSLNISCWKAPENLGSGCCLYALPGGFLEACGWSPTGKMQWCLLDTPCYLIQQGFSYALGHAFLFCFIFSVIRVRCFLSVWHFKDISQTRAGSPQVCNLHFVRLNKHAQFLYSSLLWSTRTMLRNISFPPTPSLLPSLLYLQCLDLPWQRNQKQGLDPLGLPFPPPWAVADRLLYPLLSPPSPLKLFSSL